MVDLVVVRVPGHPSSPNALRGGHWARSRHAAEWRRTAALCARDATNRIPGRREDNGLPFERARITTVWTYPAAHLRDPDNALASAKPLIDGLIDAGVIAGDTERHVEHGRPEQQIIKGLRSVELRVERLP